MKRETKNTRRAQGWIDPGEARAWLLTWLNGNHSFGGIEAQKAVNWSVESAERVHNLLSEIRRVQAIKYTDPDSERATWPLPIEALSKRLSAYAIFPVLAVKPANQSWSLLRRAVPTNPYPWGETLAIHGLLEMARENSLTKVQQCGEPCEKWYFARRGDAVACGSDTCRRRAYDRKPEVKAKRKKQAQDNSLYNSGLVHVRRKNAKATKS